MVLLLRGEEKHTYKSIALGSSCSLVRDDDSLQDLTILLKMLSHGLLLRLPCQPSHEHLRQCGIAELPHRLFLYSRYRYDILTPMQTPIQCIFSLSLSLSLGVCSTLSCVSIEKEGEGGCKVK